MDSDECSAVVIDCRFYRQDECFAVAIATGAADLSLGIFARQKFSSLIRGSQEERMMLLRRADIPPLDIWGGMSPFRDMFGNLLKVRIPAPLL